MKNFLKLLTLLMMVMFVSAAPAAAAEDDYYYPGYDPAVEGYVDLMQYMTGITITAGGKKYTKEALQELKDKGTPLEVDLGDTVTFNFDFSLCGRRYDDDDPTLFSEAKSVKTVYTHDTRYLNGTEITAGSTAVLDDSSLMLGTSMETTCLRMDIAWMLELCPQNFSIQYREGDVSFRQGEVDDDNYLYVYFPNGIGANLYANPGTFSISMRIEQETDEIVIPGKDGYYVPGTDEWRFPIHVKTAEQKNTGHISAYGDIAVRKVWETNEEHGDAVIVLSYTMDGQKRKATRTISDDETARFTIREGMEDCTLTEDMSALPNYISTLTEDDDGRTFTFYNKLKKKISITKTDEEGKPLPGADLILYRGSGESEDEIIDRWTSTKEAHILNLTPGSYTLQEITPPAGYIPYTVFFTVTEDYEIETQSDNLSVNGNKILMEDRGIRIRFVKTNDDNEPLAGAELRLTDAETKDVIDTWTSTEEPHDLAQTGSGTVPLRIGHTYILEELKAPKGYDLADPITFTLAEDGTVTGFSDNRVVMVDRKRGRSGGGGGGREYGGRDSGSNNGDNGGHGGSGNGDNGGEGGNRNNNGGEEGGKGGNNNEQGGRGPFGLPLFGGPEEGLVRTGDSPAMWVGLFFFAAAGLAAVCCFAALIRRSGKKKGKS